MRKKTRSARFTLSVESLDQRIAPSGFAPAPDGSAPADTSSPSGGSTSIGTPPVQGPPPSSKG